MTSTTHYKSKAGSTRSNLIIIPATAAVLFGTGLYLRNNHARMNDRLDALVQQNQALNDALNEARVQIDELSSGDSSQATRERLEQERINRVPQPPKEEIETLFLQDPVVEPTTDGLLVHLAYTPEPGIGLPDSTTLVFRVPSSGSARILSLNAKGSSSPAIINADGTLAMLEYSPSESGELALEFKVSQPATAILRGSEGIIDVELAITNERCTVRKL